MELKVRKCESDDEYRDYDDTKVVKDESYEVKDGGSRKQLNRG